MERYVAPEGYDWKRRNPWVPENLKGTPGDWQSEPPDYYGIRERIDECYGRLLDALDRAGELENTVVVFTSDHGSHFRTRNQEYKRSCHESSIRIPGIVRGPGFEDGHVRELVNLIDLPVTLVDNAGIDVPDRMEGNSLLALLDDGGKDGDNESVPTEWKDAVFVQPMSGEEVPRTIRTDRWKYSVYAPDAGPWETPQPEAYVERYLYDLRADPHTVGCKFVEDFATPGWRISPSSHSRQYHEQDNLAGRDDYRAVADDLREQRLAQSGNRGA